MNNLTRQEIGKSLEGRTQRLVLIAAQLFVTMGSLWTHAGTGSAFANWPVLLCWSLIHGSACASLFLPRLNRVLLVAGFAGLLSYFWMYFANYRVPFVPVANVFFLVTALSLVNFRPTRIWPAYAAWGGAWLLAGLWMGGYGGANGMWMAFGVALLLNVGLLSVFAFASRWTARQIADDLRQLGPQQGFDERRLHAAKLQSLGEFSASLAHEIANPLVAIQGFNHQIASELKEADPDRAMMTAAADRVTHNVKRIMAITKLLRTFTRDTSREEHGAVLLRDVIDDTLGLIQPLIKMSGVEIHVDSASNDARVSGNLIELSQLLGNLLSNGRDACVQSARKELRVGCELRGNEAHLWVEDSGPGVPAEIGDRLFNPYFTTKEAGKGTGLGLYISKIIADRHHARLAHHSLRNAAGEITGTRFELSLAAYVEDLKRAA